MPAIINIPETWTAAGTTAGTEIWQCTAGKVAISVQAAPDDDEGTVLKEGDAVKIAAGKDVLLRRVGGSAAKVTVETFE
jgi:hypothetical protein